MEKFKKYLTENKNEIYIGKTFKLDGKLGDYVRKISYLGRSEWYYDSNFKELRAVIDKNTITFTPKQLIELSKIPNLASLTIKNGQVSIDVDASNPKGLIADELIEKLK